MSQHVGCLVYGSTLWTRYVSPVSMPQFSMKSSMLQLNSADLCITTVSEVELYSWVWITIIFEDEVSNCHRDCYDMWIRKYYGEIISNE